MYTRAWSFKETNLVVKSDTEQAINAAVSAALEARRCVERFIVRHPEFRYSLEPLRLNAEGYPRIIGLMLRAALLADVGPFAAVAGAISQVAAEAAISVGAKNVLVENGGDISIIGNQEFRVGIYAGKAKISGKIGFLVQGKELPIGICTSSGRVGHSVSFGDADAVIVTAREASIADAAATSVANAVEGTDVEASIKRGLDRADATPKIRGCLVVRGDYIGTSGKLPKLIQVSSEGELSTTSRKYRAYGVDLLSILEPQCVVRDRWQS